MNRPKIEDRTREITSYNLNGSKEKQKVVDLKKYSFNLERYCDQLEKALDKACEELEKCQKDFDKIYDTSYAKIKNKKYWKKELMKDD